MLTKKVVCGFLDNVSIFRLLKEASSVFSICLFCFDLQSIKAHKEEASFAKFGLVVLFHVSFFIFITTIGLNIIFGIIVDTFSELRDLKVRLNDAIFYYLLLAFVQSFQTFLVVINFRLFHSLFYLYLIFFLFPFLFHSFIDFYYLLSSLAFFISRFFFIQYSFSVFYSSFSFFNSVFTFFSLYFPRYFLTFFSFLLTFFHSFLFHFSFHPYYFFINLFIFH